MGATLKRRCHTAWARSNSVVRNYVKDRVTGEEMAPIRTSQIYWGAVPFVVIQVIMIGVVISFPYFTLAPSKSGFPEVVVPYARLDGLWLPGLTLPP